MYELKDNNKNLEISNLLVHWSWLACLKDTKDFRGACFSLLQCSFCELPVDDKKVDDN